MLRICKFTLMELLVVIAILLILISLLMPALRTAKEKGQQAACKGNLKQIYLGMTMYANDSGDYYPGNKYYEWFLYLHDGDFLKKGSVYKCPLFSQWAWTSNAIGYGVNAYPWKWSSDSGNWIRPVPSRKRSTISLPTTLAMHADTDYGFWHAGVNMLDLPASMRHFGGPDVLWCDGHADWHLYAEMNAKKAAWFNH